MATATGNIVATKATAGVITEPFGPRPRVGPVSGGGRAQHASEMVLPAGAQPSDHAEFVE
jgi:hypothetical protein